jgi:hypothetical protein
VGNHFGVIDVLTGVLSKVEHPLRGFESVTKEEADAQGYAAECFWKLAREDACRKEVANKPYVLYSLAALLGGAAKVSAISALWGLTVRYYSRLS